MEEKKIIFMIVGMEFAILCFLATNVFLPISRDNKDLIEEYKQLKSNVGKIEGYNSSRLETFNDGLALAISTLEKSFLEKDRLKLTEQLTQLPLESQMVFSNIAHKEPLNREGCQIIQIDIMAKATFYNVMKYLASVESMDLMIGVDSLSLHKINQDSPSLEMKATFSGFRLISKKLSISGYLEEKYQTIDESRLKDLIKPIASRQEIDVIAALGDYDPFVYINDLQESQIIEVEEEIIEEVVVPEVVEERFPFEEFSLNGIIHLDGKRVALINNSTVEEGDIIEGVRVVEIKDYEVTLLYLGKIHTLKIGVDD